MWTQLLLGMEAQVVFFVFNFVARTAALPNSSGVVSENKKLPPLRPRICLLAAKKLPHIRRSTNKPPHSRRIRQQAAPNSPE